MKEQMTFHADLTACVGCRTCELACKDKQDLDVGVRWRRVRSIEGGEYPSSYVYNISMSCNHCADPACLKACPTKAYSKNEQGIVIHDKERCVGCRYCIMACPYSSPQFNPREGKVGKCDFCRDLLQKGKNPACVDACPLRVLHAGTEQDIEKKYHGTNSCKGVPDPNITQPSIRFTHKSQSRAY